MNNKSIFILEDEANIRHLVEYNLELAGFNVAGFGTGRDFFEAFEKSGCDMVLLDIMLPDTDGFSVLADIRKSGKYSKTPVLMLTAKKDEVDKVLGLEMGADDYITKPFGVRELVSRVKAVLRRSVQYPPDAGSPSHESIKVGNLELFPGLHKVEKSGVEINLSLKEYQLLKMLMSEPGKVFTRDVLLDRIWGYDYFGETRTVDVHIRYLRRKLDDDGPDFKYIDTVRGVGYKLKT